MEGTLLQARPVVGDELHPLPVGETETAGQAVELANEMDAQLHHIGEGLVAVVNHVAAQLTARFLQGGDGRSRRDTCRRAAVGHIAVSRRLLHLGDFVVQIGHIHPVQPRRLNGRNGIRAKIAVGVDERPRPVGVLVLVHRTIIADEEAGRGRRQRVLQNGLVHEVNLLLRTLAQIDVTVAAGRTLLGEEIVEHEGVLPVVVPASRRKLGVILRGVQHFLPHELAKLHRVAEMVVPIHHHGLVGSVHRIVVEIAAEGHAAASELALQLGIGGAELLVVHQLRGEEVGALLHIGDTRLPKEVQ